jgi:VanZ family protein
MRQGGLARAAWRWGPALGYACLIYALSAQSDFPAAPPGLWDLDKLLHGVEYAALGLLLMRALRPTVLPLGRAAALAAALATAYAVSDELHQSVVPGRNASVADAAADAAGASLACCGWYALARRRSQARPA